MGYAADGSLVLVTALGQNGGEASLILADPETLEVGREWSGVVGSTVSAADLSPDGTRLVLATDQGHVGVFDLADGVWVDRADPGLGALRGVQWVDDTDLVVLAASGALVRITTDVDRLLELTRSSLTRGLSLSECTSYQIDPCPHLGDLRGGGPTVPEPLLGSWSVSWTPDGLGEAAVEVYEAAYGAALDEASLTRVSTLATDLAGRYLLTFGERGYEVTRDGELWCAGAVSRHEGRPDRLLLGADRGPGCLDYAYAEIGWAIEGDLLHLPAGEFRGGTADEQLWTLAPLQRVDA